MQRRKPVIGIAGGIGAGKSSVARIFESLGAVVVDSDRMAHEELREPEVVAKLRAWWGSAVCPDGKRVDRKLVAEIVFNDRAELARLEGLIYPRLEARRCALFERYAADDGVLAIVIDAPKLFEAGLDRQCDAVVFVDAAPRVRSNRLSVSRGWTEDELHRRENLQEPLDTKKAKADYTVVNNSRIDELRPEIERILSAVLAAHLR